MRGTTTPLQRGPFSITIPDTAGIHSIPSDGSGSGLSDDLMPWIENIDVFMTPVSHVNWNTKVLDINHLYDASLQSSGAQNDEISFMATLARGTWMLRVLHDTAGLSGIITVLIDGISVGTIDTYGASATSVQGSVSGINIPTSGAVTLTLRMATKNASSGGYFGGISHLQFQRTA